MAQRWANGLPMWQHIGLVLRQRFVLTRIHASLLHNAVNNHALLLLQLAVGEHDQKGNP